LWLPLRHDGHDVVFIAEVSPSIADDEVLNDANALHAVLLTADKDFGEMVFRQHRVHAGVVLIRLAGLSAAAKAQTVCSAFKDHGHEFVGSFSVISTGLVRVRRSI
jgi:predicted nuclease of predicted toxin-antitoxin system